MQSVGARVRELRRARGLTQRVLADRAGLYHTTISELERGVTVPGIDTLDKIATVLKVHLSDIVSDARTPVKKP